MGDCSVFALVGNLFSLYTKVVVGISYGLSMKAGEGEITALEPEDFSVRANLDVDTAGIKVSGTLDISLHHLLGWPTWRLVVQKDGNEAEFEFTCSPIPDGFELTGTSGTIEVVRSGERLTFKNINLSKLFPGAPDRNVDFYIERA